MAATGLKHEPTEAHLDAVREQWHQAGLARVALIEAILEFRGVRRRRTGQHAG
jgi:hypothetical protein